MNDILQDIIVGLDEGDDDLKDIVPLIIEHIKRRAFRCNIPPDLMASACYMCPVTRTLVKCNEIYQTSGCYIYNKGICRIVNHNYQYGCNQPYLEDPTDEDAPINTIIGTDYYSLCCSPADYGFNIENIHVFKGYIISHHSCNGKEPRWSPDEPTHGPVTILNIDIFENHTIPCKGTYKFDHYYQKLYYIDTNTITEVTDIIQTQLILSDTKVTITWDKRKATKLTIHRGILFISGINTFYNVVTGEAKCITGDISYGCYYGKINYNSTSTSTSTSTTVDIYKYDMDTPILKLAYRGQARPKLRPGYLSVRNKHYNLDILN